MTILTGRLIISFRRPRSRPIKDVLSPGEKVLWSGQPPRKLLVFHASDLFILPFALFWTGFSLVWELGALAAVTGSRRRFPGLCAVLPAVRRTVRADRLLPALRAVCHGCRHPAPYVLCADRPTRARDRRRYGTVTSSPCPCIRSIRSTYPFTVTAGAHSPSRAAPSQNTGRRPKPVTTIRD